MSSTGGDIEWVGAGGAVTAIFDAFRTNVAGPSKVGSSRQQCFQYTADIEVWVGEGATRLTSRGDAGTPRAPKVTLAVNRDEVDATSAEVTHTNALQSRAYPVLSDVKLNSASSD